MPKIKRKENLSVNLLLEYYITITCYLADFKEDHKVQ